MPTYSILASIPRYVAFRDQPLLLAREQRECGAQELGGHRRFPGRRRKPPARTRHRHALEGRERELRRRPRGREARPRQGDVALVGTGRTDMDHWPVPGLARPRKSRDRQQGLGGPARFGIGHVDDEPDLHRRNSW
jgi:hypothetical protein